MPLQKLREFLDGHKIAYEVISHSQAYTAQKTAAAAHIPGKELAKTVMIKIDGKLAMAVLPGSMKVDFDLLRQATKAKEIVLATEREFGDLFPDCEMGAMPPFGNLYSMKVFVADSLAEDDEIAFNAGTHRELLRMAYTDFNRLVKPKTMRFARQMRPVG